MGNILSELGVFKRTILTSIPILYLRPEGIPKNCHQLLMRVIHKNKVLTNENWKWVLNSLWPTHFSYQDTQQNFSTYQLLFMFSYLLSIEKFIQLDILHYGLTHPIQASILNPFDSPNLNYQKAMEYFLILSSPSKTDAESIAEKQKKNPLLLMDSEETLEAARDQIAGLLVNQATSSCACKSAEAAAAEIMELTKYKDEFQLLQKDYENYRISSVEENRLLSNQIEELRRELQQVKDIELQQARNEIKNYENYDNLEQELQDARIKINVYIRQIDKLEQELQRAWANTDLNRNPQIEDLKKELISVKGEADIQIKNLEQKLQMKDVDLQRARSELKIYIRQIENLEQELERARVEINVYIRHTANLEQDLQRLLSRNYKPPVSPRTSEEDS